MHSKAIIETIAYFDIFEYPVTLLELHNFLLHPNPVSLNDLRKNVNKLINDGSINELEGFYFFPKKERNVFTRKERYNYAEEKYKIALKGAKMIKYVPFLKFVAVCNNLSNNNVQKDSDIDLFIVTQKNRLYFVRMLVTLIISLKGLRRHKDKVNNRLCLSFYVTENELDFSKIKILDNDFYLMFWLANLYPIYNEGYLKEIFNNNLWVSRELGNLRYKEPSYRRKTVYNLKIARLINKILDNRIADFFELITKKIQLVKMKKNVHSVHPHNDTRVIISDDMLKFHETDRRKYYHDLYLSNLLEFNEKYAEN